MSASEIRPIRVLIVEDSDVVRMLLEQIINADPRLQVVGTASSGERALEIIERVAPDVVSLDIRLPGIDGFETTRRIMATRPTPIVVVSASVESADLQISMKALRAGALSVVEKPVGPTNADYDKLAAEVCRQLVLMSDVRVIRRRGSGAVAPRPGRATGADSGRVEAGTSARVAGGRYAALGIVASTGGPNAVIQVLQGLGPTFPLPIVLVQHITDTFHDGFVRWLGSCVPMPVADAEDGVVPIPGCVYVAPAGMHLYVEARRLRTLAGPHVAGQRPSGTVLFDSMARTLGKEAVAVLLTGMGSDGAEGLKAIHEAGGYTVVEDESTAVVFGMPGAAVRLGAVVAKLPLPDIAPHLHNLVFGMQGAT